MTEMPVGSFLPYPADSVGAMLAGQGNANVLQNDYNERGRPLTQTGVVAGLSGQPQGSGNTLLDELTGMPGQQRDAYAALKTLFDSYGLGTLAPTILTYLQ